MRSFFTLRKALALNFILVAILPLTIVGLVGLQIVSRTVEKEISERNSQHASALSGEIDTFLAESIRILEFVTDRSAFSRNGGKTLSPDDFLRLLHGRF